MTDRESIVRFLRDECSKVERDYNEHIKLPRPDDDDGHLEYDLKTARLDAKVSILRTMAAYIQRGDDKTWGWRVRCATDEG